MNEINDALNSHSDECFEEIFDGADINYKDILIVKDGQTNKRGKLLDVVRDRSIDQNRYNVLCVDYGKTVICSSDCLFKFVDDRMRALPPTCFECRLAGIRPSTMKSENNIWNEDGQKLVMNALGKANNEVTIEVWKNVPLDILFSLLSICFFFSGLFSGEWRCQCLSYHK